MITNLSLAAVLIFVTIWCFAWALIGVLFAGFMGVNYFSGLIHGLVLGPVGVLVLVVAAAQLRRSGGIEAPIAEAISAYSSLTTTTQPDPYS